ncbi:hypothetical protein CXB51_029351 [Gossypium anomalum]|uniref:Reverse transcriptase Ty1/copia-type domain-containing protein n=1 Tax=Gossypium anomalum TaxID=47600 RepID=A0A8J5Y1P9_9ROSI|nr:hypothetical protein CXB51_029351 [Gossypium anomalum]
MPASFPMAPSTANIWLPTQIDSCDIFTLWHKRLGHPSASVVKNVLDKCSIVFNKDCLDTIYTACQKWKSHKLPFSLSNTEYSEPFALVVSDLWGPAFVICGRNWYYVSFIDMCTRFTWIYLIRQKSQAVDYFNKTGWLRANIDILSTGVSRFWLKQIFQWIIGGRSSSSGHSLFSTYVPLVKPVCSRPLEPFFAQNPEFSSPPGFCPSTSANFKETMGSTSELRSVPCLLDGDYNDSSPTVPSGSANPPTIPTNTHPMVTRSKVGIFKPKAMTVEAIEPHTIEEAFSTPEWRDAAQAEYDALLSNSTWELVPVPNHCKVTGCKWLFKVKKNPDGTIARWKARLVGKGCSQLRQVDVNNAFLNGDLTDEVFMQQPPGYVQYGSNVTPSVTLYVLAYVDDIIITGSEPTCINSFVQRLNKEFSLKYMGDLHYFLGIEVTRSATGCLHICQRKYIHDLLDRSSMTHAKSVRTLMVSSSPLSKDDGEPLHDPTENRSLAGALQYMVLTRPDIAYAKQQVVSRSTAEAEYRSLAATTSDVAWLVSLLQELQLQTVDPPTIWCDNSSVVAVGANPVLHSKFKHVELDLLFMREKVADGSIIVGEVPTCDQVSNSLTKPLFTSSFARFRSLLRVLPVRKMGEC